MNNIKKETVKNRIRPYALVLIILVTVLMISGCKKEHSINVASDPYEEVVKKINNKESLNLVLIKKDSAMNKVFEYYEDAYGIKFNRLYVDKNSLGYKQLMKALDQDIEEDNEIIFQIIKDGVPNHIIKGLFSEKDLKKQLIEQKVLGEEYKDIDTFMDSDFKYNKDETYNVLYINQSDKNIYEYRKLLVKNKIKSLIIYAGNITQRNEEQSIREKLNIPNNTYDNLPILIKMKNKEIINSYNNISLNDLVKNCKQ